MKLLPPENLEQLDIPVEQESSRIPVGEVLYMSESDRSFVGANVTLSQLRTEDTRFNLFTGNQTFEERDRSFEVMRWFLFSFLATFLLGGSYMFILAFVSSCR